MAFTTFHLHEHYSKTAAIIFGLYSLDSQLLQEEQIEIICIAPSDASN